MDAGVTVAAPRNRETAQLAGADARILLAGNPNCGKTTLFNVLTGHRYKVANYPGVTVERKEGRLTLPEHGRVRVVDLPGIYSLGGQSEDEIVAERALRDADPSTDLIVMVADASNLERNLYLVSEMIDLGFPLVLVLNMSDIARRDGTEIREVLLSKELGVPVVPISAARREGIETLQAVLGESLVSRKLPGRAFAWTKDGQPPSELTSSKIASLRYEWIHRIIKRCVIHKDTDAQRVSDRLDAVLLHPVWGLVIFALLMIVLFQAVFTWASIPMDLIESGVSALSDQLAAILPSGALRSLLLDGVLAGVGSVVVFIPQIAVLFFCIGLLEESGYLCRAAFLMDRVMRHVGLQGRSFIPLLSSFACAVPGIMAARTIPSRADRLITILVAPLMSCSARLPVYAVLIGAFVPATTVFGVFSLQGLLLFGLYFLGIAGAAGVAWLLRFSILRGQPAVFLMEMPRFKVPSLRMVLQEVWDRVRIFLRTAGTVILACSIVLWFLASYPKGPEDPAEAVKQSYAGRLGHLIEPAIEPLGYSWEIGIGLLASFAAREVFVSSLATVYNLEGGDSSARSLTSVLQQRHAEGAGFGLPTALSLLVFYVFACQCISTLAVCRRETGSWAWVGLMIGYMSVLAYVGALVTYRLALSFGV